MTDITQIPARLPEAYTRKANFTDDYINDPTKPVTPQKVDAELNAIVRVLQDTQARAALIQRDDGALQNESVARETLKPEVFEQLEALEAAASDSADAAAASASAAAASAQAAADDAAATAADRLATAADALATAADRTATAADAMATAADRAVVEALSAQFRGTYYGALATDPATDPLGSPPTPGDLYFNTTTSTLRLFDGVAWNLASVDPSTLGTAAAYNVGTASDQIPTNGDLGTAATYNVGTASDQIPTNGDLGTAATCNVGTASDQIPTNADLPNFGDVVTYDTGTAAGQVPRNQDLGSASQADIATLAQALAGDAGVLPDAAGVHAAFKQYGFGSTTYMPWPTNNINDHVASGWYYADTAKGFPISPDGLVWTYHYSDLWAVQEAYDFRSSRTMRRSKSSGSWLPWQEIFHSGNASSGRNLQLIWSGSSTTVNLRTIPGWATGMYVMRAGTFWSLFFLSYGEEQYGMPLSCGSLGVNSSIAWVSKNASDVLSCAVHIQSGNSSAYNLTGIYKVV